MWADQTQNGNNAGQRADGSADELPQLISGAVNGKPAVRFDGVDDVLEIVNSPSLQPLSGDWTVFFVAKRLTTSQGDFPQIIGSRPWVAGLDKGWAVSFSTGGLIGSHLADGSSGHDVPAVLSATALSQDTFQVWQVEENRSAGTTKFYLSGAPDRTLQTAMPAGPVDQIESIYLGREIGGANNRRANMDLAEVLVYNRVLSKADRDAVAGYLSDKYGLPFAPNRPPAVSLTSPADGASFDVPANVTITAAATDTDGTVVKVEFFEGVRFIATATAAPYSVPISIQSTGSVTFTAVATDNLGERTTSAPVAIALTGSPPPVPGLPTEGLQLRLSADAGVTKDALSSVSAWADQSPNGHQATQDNAGATPPDSFQPSFVAEALNGKAVVRFDGVDDFMVIPNSPSLQPLSGDWTVLFVGKQGPASRGDFPQIIGSRPWTAGLDKGWAVCFSAGGLIGSHLADGSAGHDVPAVLSATALSKDTFQVWQVEENRSAGSTAFYLFGELDRQLNVPMPAATVDQPNDIYIGSEVEGADVRRANIDLAEIAVYNRVLSNVERDTATTHFLRKYGITQLVSRNQAPAVTLTSPGAGATFDAPAEIKLAADASDADGSIARVEFFRDGTSLGAATASPYSIAAKISSAGDFALRAVATDNLGATTVSDPVNVKVTARGVELIGSVDYSDSFALNSPRQNGLYNDNSAGGYNLENTHGNPAATWTPQSNFSFNDIPGSFGSGPTVLAAAIGNSGAATGVAQSGGGDFSFTYGLRTDYVVEVDAFLSPGDRTDISSLPQAGNPITTPNSLTVFFRRDSIAGLPGIGLFNGAKETAVMDSKGNSVKTGVDDDNWHKLAIHFNQDQDRLRIFVDGVFKADLNLKTFAGGIYENYSNGAVGAGGAGAFVAGKVLWFDNFQVGAPAKLIKKVDYTDTFTLNEVRTDGLFNDNSGGAYNVEGTFGNPEATWTPQNNFSFNTPASSTAPDRLPAATGNVGADTGLAQSGGGDFSFTYGSRNDYIVQVDAILPADRLDITSLPAAGGGIFGADKLSVFLRRDSTAGRPHAAFPETGLPGIGLYNGSKETGLTDGTGNLLLIGVDDDNWHNYAVHFDQPNHELKLYVDGALKATLDLAAFAGGIYQDYSNGAVGMGGSGGVFWMDNFQVGEPEVAAPPPVRLGVALKQGKVEVSWTGAGTLEEAGAVTGLWTPVGGAASPFTVTPTAQQKFYRLRQ